MKNKEQEIKEEIEKGVWIVYDLEANRKIQELLISNEFKFRFDPSLEIIRKEIKQEFEKEKSKWIEERGRMAKLLFEKGVKSW